jgi:hypothetical protein
VHSSPDTASTSTLKPTSLRRVRSLFSCCCTVHGGFWRARAPRERRRQGRCRDGSGWRWFLPIGWATYGNGGAGREMRRWYTTQDATEEAGTDDLNLYYYTAMWPWYVQSRTRLASRSTRPAFRFCHIGITESTLGPASRSDYRRTNSPNPSVEVAAIFPCCRSNSIYPSQLLPAPPRWQIDRPTCFWPLTTIASSARPAASVSVVFPCCRWNSV